jgi:hypothetical protein
MTDRGAPGLAREAGEGAAGANSSEPAGRDGPPGSGRELGREVLGLIEAALATLGGRERNGDERTGRDARAENRGGLAREAAPHGTAAPVLRRREHLHEESVAGEGGEDALAFGFFPVTRDDATE